MTHIECGICWEEIADVSKRVVCTTCCLFVCDECYEALVAKACPQCRGETLRRFGLRGDQPPRLIEAPIPLYKYTPEPHTTLDEPEPHTEDGDPEPTVVADGVRPQIYRTVVRDPMDWRTGYVTWSHEIRGDLHIYTQGKTSIRLDASLPRCNMKTKCGQECALREKTRFHIFGMDRLWDRSVHEFRCCTTHSKILRKMIERYPSLGREIHSSEM